MDPRHETLLLCLTEGIRGIDNREKDGRYQMQRRWDFPVINSQGGHGHTSLAGKDLTILTFFDLCQDVSSGIVPVFRCDDQRPACFFLLNCKKNVISTADFSGTRKAGVSIFISRIYLTLSA